MKFLAHVNYFKPEGPDTIVRIDVSTDRDNPKWNAYLKIVLDTPEIKSSFKENQKFILELTEID